MASEKNKHLVLEGDIYMDDRMTPETKEFIKNMIKTARPADIIKLPVDVIRNGRIELVKKLNASIVLDNLLPTRDIMIENKFDQYKIPARVFQPKEVRANSPITVFYHGGGWTLGSIETHHFACATLASATRTVWVSVDYRLAPENKFDTQLTDYRSSFEWIAANRAQFGVSADAKIGVSGDSAGGQIAALLAHEYKSQIDFQILIYPCVHLNIHLPSNDEFTSECHFLTPQLLDFFGKNFLDSIEMADNELVSPMLRKDFTNLPQCLIVIAELDPLVDQCKAYNEKLIANGNKSDLKIVNGTIHSFFHNGPYFKKAFGQSVQYIVEFLEKI